MSNFIFRLPLDNQLTDAQRIALEYDTSIVISGGPGSGKTVVTINRFLLPVKNNRDAMLFTYNKTLLASIKGLLRTKSEEIFGELDEASINRVITTRVASFSKYYGDINYIEPDAVKETFNSKIKERADKKFAEVFFDEAQDLTPAVFSNAFVLADKVSCGADNAQNLQGNFPPDEAVEIIFNNLNDQQETYLQQLEANFRNTQEIFDFARKLVPHDENVQSINITTLPKGERPEILDNLNDANQLNKIREIITNNPNSNIGILVNYGNQVIAIKEYLEQNGYSCAANAADNISFSYYCSGMPSKDEANVFDKLKTPFIVTYDSCKGLEFDIVILPFFNDAETALTKTRKKRVDEKTWVEEKNIDGSPKMWATRNHYYVGATRARTLLYILCNTKPNILAFHVSNSTNQNNKPN